MNIDKINEMLKPYGLNQISEIPIESIVFEDEVRKNCEANVCGRYGKTWGCPPGIGPVAGWREKAMSFTHAVMFNYVGNIEDSYDFEGMQEIGKRFGEIVSAFNKKLQEDNEKYLLFGAGSCSLCEKCTYPDEPCRHPEKMVPSMESCGMFVAKMAEPNGFKYINGTNTVTYFGLIVY
ncbi:MAG TPA: DUF2284 domain-containing protein [Oscillospiraceae bacterium]|nr:DUF2284 domain-containing protein [Oscillospiraceae bacterium]HPK34211.1 DUF2284 domain-containing protein [Oscillospiraceae bacterium]HPR74886.1 DUF2284 domain-containing protein [Oscillospiraceae bacterium]